MKRSTAINLLLMGAGVSVIAAIVFPYNDSVSAGAYESVDQCAADGRYPRDACERAFNDAQQEHLRASPRYARIEDCEAEFGVNECLALPQSGSSAGPSTLFVPAMAGFLLAQASNSGFAAQPLYRPCLNSNDPQCRPAGAPTSGGSTGGGFSRALYTASGDRVAAGPGVTSVGRSVVGGHASSITLARGGFGARAAAHASS